MLSGMSTTSQSTAQSVSEMDAVEIAALKFSAFCRAIGWKYHSDHGPNSNTGEFHVAHDEIEQLVRLAIESGPGEYGRGIISVSHMEPDDEDGPQIEISVRLAEFSLPQ